MATEAKFRITDPGTFWSLQTIDHLAQYSFSARQIEEIDDVYLDTKKLKLLAAGYCCRRRNQGKGFLITLTRLGSGKGTSKKLKKWHVLLKKNKNGPANWPKSEARTRVLKVISDKNLRSILTLHQTRITRLISKGDHVIAQADLDDVLWITDGKEQQFKTLKIKIIAPYQEKHLNALVTKLQAKWPLEPELLTKFERAIAMKSKKTK